MILNIKKLINHNNFYKLINHRNNMKTLARTHVET